ncbi:unnamed protein product [Gemmata massiliana]|uniref:Uncharacterized protein n=1 Tax=Gemmata massiliana TaxID=1210884 RepID=A0A6P2CWK2_9BACT|nr:unnamed protein product [Gemmata massiliana]
MFAVSSGANGQFPRGKSDTWRELAPRARTISSSCDRSRARCSALRVDIRRCGAKNVKAATGVASGTRNRTETRMAFTARTYFRPPRDPGFAPRLQHLIAAVRFVAYKIALVLVLAGASANGGAPEDVSSEAAEVLKEAVVCSAPVAPNHPSTGRATWTGSPLAVTPLPRPNTSGSLPHHSNHSLPNGLRAPLRC